MKILWLIFSLLPTPFLFHFYEYGQHLKQEEAPYLNSVTLIYVILSGFLSGQIKISYVILINVLSSFISILLATYFIANDGAWFKPVGRNGAIIFTAILFLGGQLIIRLFSKPIFKRNN
ncbi:hypothetical protein [Gottfriedia acidiceleris]|uniref:hypothetical protein n=1 Tax=Gottfriedia acidiceleris TaxID=371036 RepID=UPI00300018C7